MACPSPGRRRMVIRSVAGERGPVAYGSSEPESFTERMAERARTDSDKPRERASVANHSFSSADTRTVIEGRDDRGGRQLMGSARSAANADIPLSCPHSNFFRMH